MVSLASERPLPLEPQEPQARDSDRLVKRTSAPESISAFRYFNMTHRLSAFSTEGGQWLRGSQDDLRIADAEPELALDEQEIVRIGGVVELLGLSESAGPPGNHALGRILHGAATLVVTTQRLIVMAIAGESALGPILHGEEIHAFVWLWDLTDMISLPTRTTLADRLAGGRIIEIFGGTTVTTIKVLAKVMEVDGGAKKLSAEDAFALLARAAAAHRLSVSAPHEHEHERLRSIIDGQYANEKDELIAFITPADAPSPPPHLVGRLLPPGGEIA